MVIEDLSSKTVFLDTAPLIYFIEGNSTYQHVLSRLFQFNDEAGFAFTTSSITLLEVLVKPLRENKPDIAAQYKEILTNAAGIDVHDVTSAVAETAALSRAKYNLRTPDAIQLATAINTSSDYFLTNDNRLTTVAELAILMVSQLK